MGLFVLELVKRLLSENRWSLAMAKVSRWRTDQLRNLVAVLKLGAIDLDQCRRAAQQNLRSGFDNSSFSRPGRPKKEQICDWTLRHCHAGQYRLVNAHQLRDGF